MRARPTPLLVVLLCGGVAVQYARAGPGYTDPALQTQLESDTTAFARREIRDRGFSWRRT
jgi:hypothetical protein